MVEQRILGAVAALGTSLSWAYASSRFALAAREVSPMRLNLARVTTTLPALAIAAYLSNALIRGVTFQHIAWLTASALCSFVVADSLFLASARRIGVSSALAIGSTYPLWTTLGAAFTGGEHLGVARACGLILCVGGTIAIILLGDDSVERGDRMTSRSAFMAGIGLAGATSMLWATNAIATREGSTGLSPLTAGWIRASIAMVLLRALVHIAKIGGPTRPSSGWLRLLPAICVDGVLGSICHTYALSHANLAVGTTLSSLAPLISSPFALWFGVERFSLSKLLAISATVAGVVVVVLS